MSAECERIFSSTKKLITPERNRMHEQIIEASECLKNWWDRGLIMQQPHTPEDNDSDDCQVEDESDDDL
jgi:hAT family C-terminal dimerisation region